MRKLLLLILMGIINYTHAQGYIELNKLLHRLEQENKINHNTEEYYNLDGKKFLYLQEFTDKTKRWVLEIKDGKSTLIELEDNKQTGETTSKIYTGDIVRKKHVVSIRVDELEGQKINIPITYLYHITYQGKVWYLIDANTGHRWIDTDYIGKIFESQEKVKHKKKKNKTRANVVSKKY